MKSIFAILSILSILLVSGCKENVTTIGNGKVDVIEAATIQVAVDVALTSHPEDQLVMPYTQNLRHILPSCTSQKIDIRLCISMYRPYSFLHFSQQNSYSPAHRIAWLSSHCYRLI